MPTNEYAYIEGSSFGVTNMGLRILTWLFPWLMAILEFLLRASVGNADAVAFVGPTVGGAALGIVLPFIRDRFFPLKPPYPTMAFRSDEKQAFIIPAEIAYDQPDIMLEIERVGDELRIRPRQPAQ